MTSKLIEDGFEQYGIQTFDQALFILWKRKRIDEQTALDNSTSRVT